MRTLFIDCTAGAAGDMLLAALIDAGAQVEGVVRELDALALEGWGLSTEQVTRSGIRANRAIVEVEKQTHERAYRDIAAILQRASLSPAVKELAQRVFRALAEAEARVHHVVLDQVHFHEVGALDSIVDVVGSCAALVALAPQHVVASSLAIGRGMVDTRHGPMPVPAPAVTELLSGAPIHEGGDGELTTPTGAALVVTFADSFGSMPPMILRATGYGAGTRDTEQPNVVRVLLGDATTASHANDDALVAEANIDDMNPEMIPYVIESLLAAGAHDAWTSPIVMKKGRPSLTLSVLFDKDSEDRILDVIYRETTTFGVRIGEVRKDVLSREWIEVQVSGQPVRVKVARRAGEAITMAPEFEDAATVARTTGMALRDVYAAALEEAKISLPAPRGT